MWSTACGEGGGNKPVDGGTSDASVIPNSRVVDYDGHSGQCLVSADCPPGSYCDLGVCTSDCDAENACEGTTVCSPHGRCLTTSEPDEDPPVTPEIVDELVVDPAIIILEPSQTQVTIRVWAANGSPFRFRVSSGASWLQVSHRQATTAYGEVEVTVDIGLPQLTDGSHGATVRVLSDIGTITVPVQAEKGLGGRYVGTLLLDGPQLKTRLPLMLDIKDLGNERWARLAAEGSPTFAREPTGTGEIDQDGRLNLTLYTIAKRGPVMAGSEPWRYDFFARPVGRRVDLSLDIGPANNLTGTYTETITGLLTTPFTVEGTVELIRQGGEEKVGSFLVQGETVVEAPSIIAPPRTAECAQKLAEFCPIPGDPTCPSELDNALDIRDGSTNLWFAFLFAQFTEFQHPTTGETVTLVDCCAEALTGSYQDCVTGDCLSVSDNSCAVSIFESHIISGGTNEDAVVGEVAGLTDLLRAAAFVGNDFVVNSYLARIRSDDPLNDELTNLDGALNVYASVEQPLFAAHRLEVLRSLRVGTQDPDAFNDLFVKMFNLLSRSQRALAQEALLRVRTVGADTSSERDELQALTETAYLRTATLGEVYRQVWEDSPPELPDQLEAGNAVTILSQRCLQLGEDRNPLGYTADYVPFFYEAGGNGTSNYEQLHNFTMTLVGDAKDDEDYAFQNARSWEDANYQVTGQIEDVIERYDEQLGDICGRDPQGEPYIDTCGENEGSQGTLGQELLNLSIEQYGVDLAAQRIQNLGNQVRIEQDRAQQVAGVRDGTISMIYATGEQMAVLTIADSFLAGMQQVVAGMGNAVSSMGASVAAGAASALLQVERGLLAAEKDRLAAMQSARMEVATQEIEIINSAATIKTMLLQMSTLTIEAIMQSLRAKQAMGRIADLYAKVASLKSRKASQLARLGQNPSVDPSYRLIRDRAVIDAETSFEDALRWVYLTARAFEYETNTDYRCIDSRLFSIRQASELRDFLLDMQQSYADFGLNYGHKQTYVDEISLREDVLGIKQSIFDPVTGEEVTPQQQFRRLLLAPANLDTTRRVQLNFSTSIAEGNGVFSTLLCNDRITSVEVMLVGDFLGDNEVKVYLTQSGSSLIRSCEPALLGTGAEFVEYNIDPDTQLIQGGVNSYGIADPNDGFFGRSVAFANWRLQIPGPNEVPDNADVDVTQIDDIVLRVRHEALTVDTASPGNYQETCN
jgi:hypothetical protein